MEHNYERKNKNIFIRQLNEDDLEYLRTWRNDPANTVYLRKIPYITPEMQKNWFRSYLADDDEMIFAIEESDEINCIVGSMALYHFADGEAEFGKLLIGEPKAHGRSIGVNALEAVKNIAKTQLNLKSLYLYVFAENAAAFRVYEKTGFKIKDKHTVANGMEEYTMSVDLEE